MANIPIIINVTYEELVNLINSNLLNPGLQYLITDFNTRHYIVDADGNRYFGEGNEVTGINEPLLVTASSINTIDKEAKSSLYPQDIIHYDWNPNNWLQDLSFADADDTSTIIISGFTGVITFRHDTLLDNYMSYDFRNVRFRRWETDTFNWDSGSTYVKHQFVNYNGWIYVSSVMNNINNIPVAGSDYWVKLLDLYFTTYWNSFPSNVNGLQSSSVYADFLTFSEITGTTALYELCCRSNHFEGFKDNSNYWSVNGTLLTNNVFFLQDDGYYTVHSNVIGPKSCGNTIADNFYGNTIGSDFFSNIVGDYFYNNNIGNSFYSNIIGDDASENTIGNNFYPNIIGRNFYSNTIGENFYRNIIGESFNFNVIGNRFDTNVIKNRINLNTIGNSFNQNNIGNDFYSNNIGNFFYSNTIGNIFYYNTIGNEFQENTTGTYFQNNIIGNLYRQNTIGNNSEGNSIANYFWHNTIGNSFIQNIIGNSFSFNNIGNNFGGNTIFNSIGYLTIPTGTTFQQNTIKDSINFTGIDFTLATYVYAAYNKEILKTPNGTIKLTYFDDSGVQQIVAVNA